jgi:nucleoside-diphosphate-sugar epimerase
LGAAFQGGGPFTNADYFEINQRGTFHMLEAAKALGGRLQQFVFAGSDAVYDKYPPHGVEQPIREDDFPLAPGGHYALSKLLGEAMCKGYGQIEGMPITICRFAMTWAGDEMLDFGQFYLAYWRKTFAQATTAEAAAVRATLEAVAAQQGERCLIVAHDGAGRSFKKHVADVRDIVGGLVAVLGRPTALGQVFQLAAPAPFTWEEAVPYLGEKLGLPYAAVNLAGTPPTYYEFDLSKLQRLGGYQPRYGWRQMIDEGVASRQGEAIGIIPTHIRRLKSS